MVTVKDECKSTCCDQFDGLCRSAAAASVSILFSLSTYFSRVRLSVLKMANRDNNNTFAHLFDDDSDSDNDFEGFREDEIGAFRRADDDDSGSELEFSDDDEGLDDFDALIGEFDLARPWIPVQPGDAIPRAYDLPQHPNGEEMKPTKIYDAAPSELDVFWDSFPQEMFDTMVDETNVYAHQWLNDPNLLPHARIRRWKDTNLNEMQAFIAMRIAMGLCPQNQAEDYFKTQHWLTDTPNFANVLTGRRFRELTSCLHFVNNDDRIEKGDPGYNPLFKIQSVLDMVVTSWEMAVDAAKYLSLDESMTPFRGRVIFRQYNKSKHHRYGVKVFALCDAATSYCLKYDIYTGGAYQYDRVIGQGCSVVLKLAENLPEGSIFYTDSFYTSPILAQKLYQKKMGLVGTVQRNRSGMPDALKEGPTRESTYVFKDPILAVSFKDRKDVRMLSTVHGSDLHARVTRASASERRRNIGDEDGNIRSFIPFMTNSYNHHMRGVDGLDQLTSYNVYPHRSRKWYIKVFNYILDIALINARVLWQLHTGTKVSATVFRRKINDQLLAPHLADKQVVPAPEVPIPGVHERLVGRHWPDHHPGKKRPRCVVCSKNKNVRHQSVYFCKTCQDHPTLCIQPCFELYHTMDDPHFDRPLARQRQEP